MRGKRRKQKKKQQQQQQSVEAWLIGTVVCLLAANRVSDYCSLPRTVDGRIVRCGIVSSCQSAATSVIAKRFWSRAWLMWEALQQLSNLHTFYFYEWLKILEQYKNLTNLHLIKSCFYFYLTVVGLRTRIVYFNDCVITSLPGCSHALSLNSITPTATLRQTPRTLSRNFAVSCQGWIPLQRHKPVCSRGFVTDFVATILKCRDSLCSPRGSFGESRRNGI